jgi:hypothetical protein
VPITPTRTLLDIQSHLRVKGSLHNSCRSALSAACADHWNHYTEVLIESAELMLFLGECQKMAFIALVVRVSEN